MLRRLLRPLVALAAAFLVVAIVLLALGASPQAVVAALASGAAGNLLALCDTAVKATPLVFTGLAVSIAFRGGLWNIGAEGQLLVGALVAAAVGTYLGFLPRPLALTLVLGSGAIAGAGWGAIAGWLKARRGVDEVISTIMLNFVALQAVSFAVHGPLMEPSRAYPTSAPIASNAELYTFFSPSRLNAGIIVAVLIAAVSYYFMFRTEYGFRLRAFGLSRRASTFYGISAPRLTMATLTFSGAIAGLGGAVQLSAISHRLYERFSPGWGFEAIAVALVARLNPIGVLATALLFGALDNGAQAMQRQAGVSPVLVQVIQGIVVLMVLVLDARGMGGLREVLLEPSPTGATSASASA